MNKLFVAIGLVLAFDAMAHADSFTFESPPYTLSSLLGQEGWYHANETAIVTDVDASEGSQSAMPEGFDCNDPGHHVYAHRRLSR